MRATRSKPRALSSPPIDVVKIRAFRKALEREACIESFAVFFQRAWPHMEPTVPLMPSVAIDGQCAAAQAVGDGRIKRLAVSTCPGTAKSLLWAVAFPAWLELREHGRSRVMVGSYSWSFATRDSRRCRDLMQTEWYRSLVNGEWEIRDDANSNDDYWTTATGRRLVTSVQGKSTGERCGVQLIDDALSASDAASTAAKNEAVRWVNTVLTSRLQDRRTNPRVMVAQRLAVDDPIADVLRQKWKYLCLPAVLGPCPELGIENEDDPCELYDDFGVLVWRDPRKPGEPIVDLLNIAALVELKREMGSSAFAAQYLQKPADDGDAIIKRAWHNFYRTRAEILPKSGAWVSVPGEVDYVHEPDRPAGCDTTRAAIDRPESFERTTMAVDLTFGSLIGDFADIKVWAARAAGRFLIGHWRKRAGLEAAIVAVEELDQAFPGCKKLIEKAANGPAAIETLGRKIPGVIAVKPLGKKAQRLGGVAPTFESGHSYLPLGAAWLGEYVEELAGATKHDDQQDTTAYAIHDLNTTIPGRPAAPRLGTV